MHNSNHISDFLNQNFMKKLTLILQLFIIQKMLSAYYFQMHSRTLLPYGKKHYEP